MREYNLKVAQRDAGRRLDLVLMEFSQQKNLGFSRTFIQKLIREGKITLKGLRIKSHYKVKADEELKVIIEDKKLGLFEPEDIPLDIVYQDQDLAIINKPSGLVVHPAPGNYTHTLVNALLCHFKKLSDINPQRPGIVHRLDKDTSGLLVVAKNNPAHLGLSQQFARHSIKRKYIAIVKGVMEFDEHIIELPIGRHIYQRQNMAVRFGKNTKYAKTYYRTLRRGQNFSLLELLPFTGRTHQLRVHLAFLSHPIIGDLKYGKNNKFTPLQTTGRQREDRVSVTGFSRLALHAQYLGFIHPCTGKFVEFTCDMPKEFTDFINEAQTYGTK